MCEDVLDSANEVINGQGEEIRELSAQNKRLESSLDFTTDELAKERAWYKNPAITVPASFVLGFVFGAYISKQ